MMGLGGLEVVDGIGDRLGPQIARTGVGWSRYKVVDGISYLG